jgi:hypothetical protein
MGEFSPEPPRKDCVLHLPLGSIQNDSVRDTSPHGNNGLVEGTPEPVTGQVGSGLNFDDGDRVVVPHSDEQHSDDALTVAGWFKREGDPRQWSRLVAKGINGAEYDLRDSNNNNGVAFVITGTGSGFRVEYGQHLPLGEWAHVAGVLTPDGEAHLYINGTRVGTTTVTEDVNDSEDEIAVASDSESHDTSEEFIGSANDVRVYTTALSAEQIQALVDIGATHLWSDQMRDSWGTDGIPYRGENKRFGDMLSEHHAYYSRQADYALDARHITDAAGEQLDKIGRGFGIRREQGEGDARYRARIKGTLIVGRSDGSFDDIVDAAASILDTDTTNVRAEADYAASPGECTLTVRQEELDNSALTASDVSTILEDVVMAGHRIVVQTQTANPFTLTDDSTPNDPSLGLTSDSISTGGRLVSDI